MEFNKTQLAAIIKVGGVMAYMHGDAETTKLHIINCFVQEYGVFGLGEEKERLFSLARDMEITTMLASLSAMNIEQKKLTCGLLSTIITCCNNYSKEEIDKWKFTSNLAEFPVMSINEANE